MKYVPSFRTKIVKIFLQKSSNFPAKLDRFSCKKTSNLAFPIEKFHLADSHFQDTGQNVK